MPDILPNIQFRIFEGEENALAELYRIFNKKLCLFSKAIVRSNEAAEEIVGDVFVKLWCNRKNITDIDNITVYLYVAVKNKSLNVLSSKAQYLVTAPFDYLEIKMDEAVSNPYDLMITHEMMKGMNHAVELLPPRCKMIFKLIREDGLRYKDVSQILNISINTIDAQMAIAVKKICTALKIESQSKRVSEPATKKGK